MSLKNNKLSLCCTLAATLILVNSSAVLASTASEMHRTKAVGSLSAGKLDTALQQLELAISADGADYVSRYYRGIVLSRMERYAEAVTDLEMAQANGAQFNKLDFELGYAYYRNRQLAKAEAALTRAWRSDPAHASTNYYLGVVHYQQQHYEECLEPLDTAGLNERKFDASAAYMRAEALHQLGRNGEAISVLDAAIITYPNSAYAEHSMHLRERLQASEVTEKAWELGLSAGVSSDSNVGLFADDRVLPPSIPEQSDIRYQLGLDASYRLIARESSQLAVGYRFFNSFHQDLSQYDLRNHSLSANYQATYDANRAGIGYQYTHSELDGRDYRVSNTLTPHLMLAHGESRASLVTLLLRRDEYQQPAQAGRDGNVYEGGYRHYWLKAAKQYTYAGVKLLRDDADDANFSNQGYGLNVGLEWPFAHHSFRAGVQYRYRDYYDAVTEREDKQWQGTVGFYVPLENDLMLRLGFSVTDNQSSDVNYDYSRHVLDMNVRWQL